MRLYTVDDLLRPAYNKLNKDKCENIWRCNQ